MTSRLSEETGRVLGGRYRLMTPVGVGTSSRVYLAVDTQLRRRVAVKLLHEALSEDEAFLRRFRAEARAAGALSHPNILAVFDWGEDDGEDGVVPYLVTEYLGGGSLRTMLDGSGRLTPSQTLVVGLDAARGLAHAHQRGLVHRDVKPANLLFDDEARLRLADFGLARALAEASWTEPTGLAIGTARYASPEQAMGRRLDGRSDVYSLALALVECVTGEVPFSGETTASTLAMRTQADLQLGVEFGGLRSILERAGRLDPEERPEAAEFEIGLMAAAEVLERPGTLPIVPSLGDGEQTTEFQLANGPDGVGAIVAVPTVLESQDPEVIGHEIDDETGPGEPPAATSDGATATHTDRTSINGSANQTAGGTGQHVRNPITVAEEHDLLSASRPASFGPIDREADGLPAARVASPSRTARGARKLRRAERAAAKVERSLSKQASPPRRGRRALAGVVVLAMLLGALGAGWWFFVRVPTHELPDLVGLPVGEATAAAEELGWTVDATTLDRADGTVPGQVLDQDPSVGEVLAEGEQVRLVVSLGQTLTDVPPVVELSLEAASEALGAAGLTVAEPLRSFDENVAVDAVISVAPADGQVAPDPQGRLPKGTVVQLVVSDGPQPRVVPAGLQGSSVGDAVAALEAIQLDVTRPESFSDDVPAGFVISVSESPGTELPRGAQVRLEVSKGPAPVPIPDVRFNTGTAGVSTLESQGFTVAGIEGSPSGMVLATDPPAGELHQRGTSVRIFTRS